MPSTTGRTVVLEEASTKMFRMGLGEDRHRLAEGGSLVLGGIAIPDGPLARHLVGHSDADVLLHAVTDALLGAAGFPDIGEMFPDTEPMNQDRNSAEILSLALEHIHNAGWHVVNVDCVLSVESPKISPYKAKIRMRLAELLQVGPDQVNVKAKTGEGVGPVGRGEVIDARCVVLLESEPNFT